LKANQQQYKETISQTKLATIAILVPIAYTLVWLVVWFLFGWRWLIFTAIGEFHFHFW